MGHHYRITICGGTQYEGNTFVNETLRYVNSGQGIDVEYENRLYGDGMDADGLEQLNHHLYQLVNKVVMWLKIEIKEKV